MDVKTTLGVITVATNKYLDYWADQARSFVANPSQDLDLTLHVFTDQPDRVGQVASNLSVRVVTHIIPNYKWPEAALYRYQLIHDFKEELTEDILMHLDADMLVRASITSSQLKSQMSNGICLVRHPGYFRPRGLARIILYFQNATTTWADFWNQMRMGSLGTWETNKDSLAFVPRMDRKHYFCGGTWWGLRSDILKLSEELASRISVDERNGIEAVWHDESHLNWWASENDHGSADPRYCFAAGFSQLRGIPIVIQAVDKQSSFMQAKNQGNNS